jgi:hypothetical protein
MITQKALEKARILAFFERHGLLTTLDAFPKVKRRAFYYWKKKWEEGGKKPEALNDRPRAFGTREK